MHKQLVINYEVFLHSDELALEEQGYVRLAWEAADRAYAPYSEFQVGAVAVLEDDTFVQGNNQENIAYPSGLCAERVALFYAGAQFPDKKVKALYIVAKGKLLQPDDCVTPCGACRQVIAETERRQTEGIRIVLVSEYGATYVFNACSDLLVFPFGVKFPER